MEDLKQHDSGLLDNHKHVGASDMDVEEEPSTSRGATITVSDDSVVSELTKDSKKEGESEDQEEGPTDMDVEKPDDLVAGGKEDDTMQVEEGVLATHVETETPSTTVELGEDTKDLLDLEKLYGLLEQSKSAGDLIAGKNVMLLIGNSGAGKTTTTLKLANVKFETVDVDGEDHFEPQDVPPELSEFVVSGGATSVTKTIHATTVTLPDGTQATICDTPGFGDSKGTEMEISNGLGVIHALKRAASVKPVLVINFKDVGGRYKPLQKTLGTVIDMMGHHKDFSAFEYVFTHIEADREIMRIHRRFAGFQKKLRDNPKDVLGDNINMKDDFDAMLSDIVMKTSPKAINIDPERGESKNILSQLWIGKPRMNNPSDSFVDFVSKDSKDKLDLQVDRMLLRLDLALKTQQMQVAEATLRQLIRLNSALSLPQMKNAVKKGETKALGYLKQLRSEAQALSDRIVKEANIQEYEKLAVALKKALTSFSEARDMCDLCRVPVEDGYDMLLAGTMTQLFSSIQGRLEEIQSNRIVEQQDVLKDSFLRVNCLSNVLKDVVDVDGLETESENVKGTIVSLLQCAASMLDQEREVSSSVLQEWGQSILFLMEMGTFFNNTNKKLTGWEEISDTARSTLNRLKEKSEECINRVGSLSSDLAEIKMLDASTVSSTIHKLTLEEVTESRLYVLGVLTSPQLLDLMYEGQQSEQSIAFALKNFDETVRTTVQKIAEWISSGTDNIVKKSSTQSLKTRVGSATALVESIKELCSFCSALKNWSKFDWDLDEADKTVFAKKSDLDQFIEAKKDISGPEPLLYGPDVLGQDFYDMLVELRAFKLEHNGDCDVPSSYRDKKLVKWVKKQRKEAKDKKVGRSSSLTDQRLEALADLDFDFSPKTANQKKWDTQFENLRKYKEEHGHVNVPQKVKPLGKWVHHQRDAMKAMKEGRKSRDLMTKQRAEALEGLGFVWKLR